MNLPKRPPESDNEKVVDPKHLKLWPEKVKRKRNVKLLSKSLDKNPGCCIMGRDEVAKPLDEYDRKMQFCGVMDLASVSQGFSESSGLRLNWGNEGSCKRKRIRCPYASTFPDDSIIKGMNTSFEKYPKHLQMRGSICLREHLSEFVECPESVRQKRSFSYHNQFSKTLENTLGSVCPGKRQKGAKEKFVTLSTHSLPEEVVEEILSRLPVRSLARFRCVCKSWHHLTYSERFISLHLKNYRTSQLIVGNCNVLREICSMYFLPPPPPTGGYSDNDGASQEMERHEFPRLFGGSCNGIVCLYSDRANENIVLWNPATNEAKKIRKYGSSRNRGSICNSTVGFGFDPKTNDYKILRMVFDEPNPPVAQMELYSMRKCSWKKVDSHDFLVVRNVSHADVACSLPFTDNRIVCAVVSPLSGTSKWEILAFDMSTETYEIISVSPTLDAELGDHECFEYRKRYFKLFPFIETIAVGIVHCIGNGRTYCDVWVLNGFKSSAQSRSWSKILTTNVNDGLTLPVGCWGSSQILFQKYSSKRLLSLDHGNNMMVELGVIPSACVTTAVYKESLVRIDDDTKEKAGDSKCL